MPRLAIRARFPLGSYLGHDGAGQPSAFPDTARLYSALVHAAGTGSTAREADGDTTPSDAAREALAWLESHPPTALTLPRLGTEPGVTSYRREGTFDKAGSGYTDRKVGRIVHPGVPIEDYVGWAWDVEVPSEVALTLDALCADVACLGEADSPVVLELADIDPTHLLADRQGPFVRGGTRVRTPEKGRFDALEADYRASHPSKMPTVGADKQAWGQRETSPIPTADGVRSLRYEPAVAPRPDLPWAHGMALATSRRLAPQERVRWAVALHRAIVARLGDDAPSLITGRYAAGARRPANRVALQYVEGPLVREDLREGAFVVMLPAEAPAEDAAAVQRAVAQVSRLFVARDVPALDLAPAGTLTLDALWLPPQAGTVRRWAPAPALVPEVRTRRGQTGLDLADAVRVSIGHAWRDRLEPAADRGIDRYRRISNEVRAWGVGVSDLHTIADSRTERYVHRAPADLVVRPVRALLDLSPLMGECAGVALGQSRHLGGGMLHPIDLPVSLIEES